MSIFRSLLRMELKRMRTVMTIAIPFLLLVLSLMLSLLEAKFSPSINVVRYLNNVVAGLSLALAGPLIGGGMLANDIKDHWARTTLLRPVTRTQFVMARITSVFLVSAITLVMNAWVPIPIASLVGDKAVVWNLSVSIPMFALFLCQTYVIIVLMTLLSCWLSGMMNIVLLGLWAILSSLVDSYVRSSQWDSGILTILKDFLFPSGFIDASRAISSGGHELWAGILWGCAAAAGFTALALWAFNRVTIEIGSE